MCVSVCLCVCVSVRLCEGVGVYVCVCVCDRVVHSQMSAEREEKGERGA